MYTKSINCVWGKGERRRWDLGGSDKGCMRRGTIFVRERAALNIGSGITPRLPHRSRALRFLIYARRSLGRDRTPYNE